MEDFKIHTNGQWSLEKSNYGPKGANLYNVADNAKRKQKNTETVPDVGANKNIKDYGGFGGSKVASIQDAKIRKLNRKQPVKQYTPEEIEEYKRKKSVEKSEKIQYSANGQWHLP